MKLNQSRLLRLISRLNENRLSDAEYEELQSLLRNSETARECYCEMQHQEAYFQQSKASAWGSEHQNNPERHLFSKWGGLGLAAAALILFTTLITSFYWGLQGVPFSKPRSPVATMRMDSNVDAKELYPGKYNLKEGAHTLDFFAGAQIKVMGPASFRIRDAMTLEVIQASISAHVTPKARGFKIIAGEATFVDLGTEFSIHASGGEASLKVFKGKVLANTTNADGSTERTQLAEPDQSLRYDPQLRRYKTIEDDFVDFHEYELSSTPPLSSLKTYQEAVLNTGPSLYWNFDQMLDGTFKDQVSDRILRTSGNQIFNTSSRNNGVVTFKQDEQFHMLLLDGTMQFRKQQPFTIEFLFCPDQVSRSTLLALFDQDSVDPNGKADHFILVETMTRPEFYSHVPGAIRSTYRSIPSGDMMDGINSFSKKQYTPGKWVHFAMTFDGYALKTYFDSELQNSVTLDKDEDLQDGDYALILGQTSSIGSPESPQSTYRPFVGSIDELAFYQHALSPHEIRKHYERMR